MSFWDDLTNLASGGASKAYDTIAQGYGQGMNDVNQGTQNANNSLTPWVNQGTSDINNMNQLNQRQQSMQNGNWMNNYQQSPYNKYLMSTGLNSMNNAAAASGALGSGANQQANANLADQIAGQGMQDYFNNENTLNTNLSNNYNNSMNRGAGASADISKNYMTQGEDTAAMRAQQAINEGKSQQAGTSGWMQTLGSWLGDFL